jgi:glycosyltransferase involved in cell wall biosynthesis
MTPQAPLLSFCVPTYRRRELLAAALRSIFALPGIATLAYEVIVSDDDEAGDLRAELPAELASHPALHIHKNAKHGQFPNLNHLVERARGEWLVFLHDDDLLAPAFLERLQAWALLDDARLDVIWFARHLIDYAGTPLRQLAPARRAGGPVRMAGAEYARRCLADSDPTFGGQVVPPMVTGLIARRSLVERAGRFPTHLTTMGDGLFLFKAFAAAREACYVDVPAVLYRVYPGTQRSVASEKGYVYEEYKTTMLDAIEFAAPRVAGAAPGFDREARLAFYRAALGINGPIAWLALHYRGGFSDRVALVMGILRDVRANAPGMVLRHFPFAPLALHLLPRALNRWLARMYVGY